MASDKMKPRLAVIGLDGADWQIMGPLIDDGSLPNLSRLMREGSHGELLSNFPPHTPAAWSTIFTGVNPGKHGIFTFHTLIPGTYAWRLTQSNDRKALALWEIANRAGLRVGAINIPMTFPAERIDGYMISGILGSPGAVPGAFWPEDLADEVLGVVPDFPMDVVERQGGEYSVEKLRRNWDLRLAVIRHLLETRRVDVLLAVITATDAVQHHWLSDPSTPLPGAAEVIRETYMRVDELIGEIAGVLGDDGDIVVLSDHGSAPVNLYLNLTRLLEDLGLVTRPSPLETLVGRVQRKLATTLWQRPGNSRDAATPVNMDHVMARSQVYNMLTHVSLRLNLAGREPAGVIPSESEESARAEIASMLEAVETEKAPWARFTMRTQEELFSGDHVELMPDLCGMTLDGQTLTMPQAFYLRDHPAFLTPQEAIEANPDIVRGTHRLQGVLLAAGPSFHSERQVEDATLNDITPTLLQVLGLPVPDYMDGSPLSEMLRVDAASTSHDLSGEREEAPREDYDEEDVAAVEKRLRDLGYL